MFTILKRMGVLNDAVITEEAAMAADAGIVAFLSRRPWFPQGTAVNAVSAAVAFFLMQMASNSRHTMGGHMTHQ